MVFINNMVKKIIYFGLPVLFVVVLVVYYFVSFQNFLRAEMEQKITQENITRGKVVNQSIESMREIIYGFSQAMSQTSGKFDTLIRTYTEEYGNAMDFFVTDKEAEYTYFSRRSVPSSFADIQYTGEDRGLRIDVIKDSENNTSFVFSMSMRDLYYPDRYVVGCVTSLKDQFPVLVEPLFEGQGFSYIFSREGHIFFDSDYFTEANMYSNIYDKFKEEGMPSAIISKMKQLVTHNEGGNFFYKVGKESKLIRFLPLDFQDWFILSAVPKFELADQMIVMLKMTVFFVFLIAFYTAIVIILFLKYLASSKKLFQKFLRTDPVTKGMSLVGFRRSAEKYIQSNLNASIVIIGMDIVGFRVINDLYGFEKGNDILILIQEELTKLLHGSGISARSSADYFYVLVNTDKNHDFI
ncbi:MAG: diguanylate cyclase domain-containing protein, partial [Treponemataceae bacterium]